MRVAYPYCFSGKTFGIWFDFRISELPILFCQCWPSLECLGKSQESSFELIVHLPYDANVFASCSFPGRHWPVDHIDHFNWLSEWPHCCLFFFFNWTSWICDLFWHYKRQTSTHGWASVPLFPRAVDLCQEWERRISYADFQVSSRSWVRRHGLMELTQDKVFAGDRGGWSTAPETRFS